MAEAETEGDNWQGLVILGKTRAGGRFRPSDWCERLHGVLRALDEEDAAEFADMVRLVNYEGNKAVWIDRRLQGANEQLFNFFSRFADDNQLQTVRVLHL
ncbi:MAG: DUF3579 domain-containing protein [Gammaproteobacteria bacterium]